MNKLVKRLLTGTLAFATILTALPVTAVHASGNQYWTESAERVGYIEHVMNDGSIKSTQVIAKLAVLVRNLEPKQGRIREEHDLWNEKWIIAHVRRTLISYGLYESGKS